MHSDQLVNKYKDLNIKDIEEILKDAMITTQKKGRAITLFTGLNGMMYTDLHMAFGGSFSFVTFDIFRYPVSLTMFSLFEKHGMYKIIHKNGTGTLRLVKGTRLILETTNIQDINDWESERSGKAKREEVRNLEKRVYGPRNARTSTSRSDKSGNSKYF
jgi:hypothetical protein